MRRHLRAAPRRAALLAVLALPATAATLAACGSSGASSTKVEATTPADQQLAGRIEGELAVYDEGFDLEVLPTDQQAQLAPILDNLPQAAGGVRTLQVSNAVVEADTDFPDDDQGAQTGRLICGAIERAVGGEDPGGHRVLGDGDAVLAECEPKDANFP